MPFTKIQVRAAMNKSGIFQIEATNEAGTVETTVLAGYTIQEVLERARVMKRESGLCLDCGRGPAGPPCEACGFEG